MGGRPCSANTCRRCATVIGRVVAGVAILAGLIWWLLADGVAGYAPGGGREVSIRFAHFGGYEDYELWADVIAEFESREVGMSRRPQVRVRQEYIVGLANRYNIKMRQQILTQTLPDVALIQLGPFHELAEHFADLSDLLSDAPDGGVTLVLGLEPTARASFRYRGRQRGLPVSGGNLLIYCNTDCFKRASRFRGEPVLLPDSDWTMGGFRRVAEQLTCDFDGDGTIDQFGFWLPRWIYYLPFIWSSGADIVDETSTQWRLTGPEAEAAFGFYRDLAVGSRRVCPRPDEVPQLFQDVGFLTGRVGMCINGPWFQPFLAATKLADSYVVAHIPSGSAGRITRITWDGVVMAPNLPPPKRTAARRFIRFLLSKAVQDRIARIGRALPARVDSADLFVDPPGNATRRRDDRRQRFVDALTYSRTQPLFSRFGQIDRAINDHVFRLLDPTQPLTAKAMLEGLSRDPEIVAAFTQARDDLP